jgi:cytochrome c553
VTAATAEQKTYNYIPANSLMTVDELVNADYAAGIAAGTATPALAKASLATQNATDLVSTPYAGACVSCHDNNATKAHIRINGGQLSVPRSSASALNESCAVCHGPGSDFDTVAVHK